MLKDFLLVFIPLFVAIDGVGLLPIFLSMTAELDDKSRKEIVSNSILTAFLVAIVFIFLGELIFKTLGITVTDFKIAGGVLLLIIAISDIIRIQEYKGFVSSSIGVVPIGTPLITGPATLTTSLILVGNYGYIPVVISLVINLLIVWLIFTHSEKIKRLIGLDGLRGLGKIVSLLLAGIAVKLIRTGIGEIISGN
ncbi:MAG: MarC family protein [Proteobacteria bacterium]|nr:MarC family protein [Pseudomonadota bacterium]